MNVANLKLRPILILSLALFTCHQSIAGPALVHYFEGFLDPTVLPCSEPACESLENGSSVFGFAWLDSEAVDEESEDPLRGVYRSEGVGYGISMYIQANNEWVHARNVVYGLRIFPATTCPGVTVQTYDGTEYPGADRISLTFFPADVAFLKNDALQFFEFPPVGCLGETLVLNLDSGSFLGRTTLVRPVPLSGQFGGRSDLRPVPSQNPVTTEVTGTAQFSTFIEPQEDRVITGLGSRGRRDLQGASSAVAWKVERIAPLSPTEHSNDSVLIETQQIVDNDSFIDIDFDISMQDTSGNVRDVFLRGGSIYKITLSVAEGTWLTSVDPSIEFPRISNDGFYETTGSLNYSANGDDIEGVVSVWINSEPIVTDADADLVPSLVDNCTAAINPSGLDSDADGYGNICDADLSQDCIVNSIDLGILRAFFFLEGNLISDLNGDGFTNVLDLGIFRSLFFEAPGPSGTAEQCQ